MAGFSRGLSPGLAGGCLLAMSPRGRPLHSSQVSRGFSQGPQAVGSGPALATPFNPMASSRALSHCGENRNVERGGGSPVPKGSAFSRRSARAPRTQGLSPHWGFAPSAAAGASGPQSSKLGLCHPDSVVGTQQGTTRAKGQRARPRAVPAAPRWSDPRRGLAQPLPAAGLFGQAWETRADVRATVSRPVYWLSSGA